VRFGRRRLLGVATAIALLALAAAALGATGSLTYEGCIANAGIDDCSEPLHNSLGNNVGLAVSPDGTALYVAAFEGTLTELRSGGGDAPDYERCFADGGAHDCRDIPHDSLEAATGVAVSPDGRSVYVTSAQRTNAVTRFKQDPGGALTYRGCSANGGDHAGLAGCRQVPRNSLDSNEAAAVSPDGGSLYVVSSDSDSITRFKRKANGALKYRGCIANHGAHRCGRPKHDSLGGAFDVAITPDGKSVYVVSLDGDAITWFDRHADGSLTYKNCFANARAHGCRALEHDSLGGADSVAVSPDGESVYVTSLGGDSITRFKRSPSGRITPGGCYANSGEHGCGEPKVNSLHAADGVAVSPDGQSVYVTSMTGPTVNGGAGAVTDFKRRADGSLGYRGCVADQGRYGCSVPRLDSLGSPQSIAIDPDGTSVFVGSYGRQVSIFRRATGGS
jgi:DNA-binding beta-propeller fold protein YncE